MRFKMEQREFIILCLEDTNDWTNATTRRLVMQVGRGGRDKGVEAGNGTGRCLCAVWWACTRF